MPLAIISFGLEITLISIWNVMSDKLSKGFGIFTIVAFVICTFLSVICIIYNGNTLRYRYVPKGVSVTGLVFSIVGTVVGLIFCIVCFGTLASIR